MTEKYDVIIVGAGASGLMAGHSLAQAGLEEESTQLSRLIFPRKLKQVLSLYMEICL
jgi:flavin-dependent dehydrogenase